MDRRTSSSFKFSFALAVGLFAGTLVTSSPASAVSLLVQRACMADYFSFCSQHAVGSSSLRSCMSSHGSRLSKRCVSALIAAGEVSGQEVSRRSSSRRR